MLERRIQKEKNTPTRPLFFKSQTFDKCRLRCINSILYRVLYYSTCYAIILYYTISYILWKNVRTKNTEREKYTHHAIIFQITNIWQTSSSLHQFYTVPCAILFYMLCYNSLLYATYYRRMLERRIQKEKNTPTTRLFFKSNTNIWQTSSSLN